MEETGILENPNLTSACYLALNQAVSSQTSAQPRRSPRMGRRHPLTDCRAASSGPRTKCKQDSIDSTFARAEIYGIYVRVPGEPRGDERLGTRAFELRT